MKKNLLISLKLTVVMVILCSVLFPLLIAAIGKATPGGGKGKTISVNGKVVGYELLGQKFTDDKYFWGRPSAVDYNAAGSAGSNKVHPILITYKSFRDRVDTFLVQNPEVKKEEIPADPGYSKWEWIRSAYFTCICLRAGKTYCNCSRNSRR
jgi:K+-transporting ATPase ATPase C chain